MCLQPDLRDPAPAYPAVAAESLHRRGAGQEAAGAHPPGPAECQAASHGDGAALPRVGGHHCQGQAVYTAFFQTNEGDEDTDLQIFCVSCSHPINPKVALRHMERCYAKVIYVLLCYIFLFIDE